LIGSMTPETAAIGMHLKNEIAMSLEIWLVQMERPRMKRKSVVHAFYYLQVVWRTKQLKLYVCFGCLCFSCCACGGGFDPSSFRRTLLDDFHDHDQFNSTQDGPFTSSALPIQSTPAAEVEMEDITKNSSSQSCWDSPNWVDSTGDGCAWYEKDKNCEYYGSQFARSLDGQTANGAVSIGGFKFTLLALLRFLGSLFNCD